MGVIANGILSYLSYKNAKLHRTSSEKDIILMAIFLSFCIQNFNGALSNFFAQDFSFIWEGIGFPYDSDWFRHFIKIVSYLVFPLFLVTKKEFAIDKTLTVSTGTYVGSVLVGKGSALTRRIDGKFLVAVHCRTAGVHSLNSTIVAIIKV